MNNDLSKSMLRRLDFDDFLVMDMLARGLRGKAISVALGLTPPAISHRFSKFTSIFEDEGEFFMKEGNLRVLTDFGRDKCLKAQKVLEVFGVE